MNREDLSKNISIMSSILLFYILFLSQYKVLNIDFISQIILLLGSVFVGYYFTKFFDLIKKKYFNIWSILSLILITFCCTFIMFGKPLILNNSNSNLFEIIFFGLSCLWIFPFVIFVIYILENCKCRKEERINPKHRWILFILFFAVWEFILFAFFPGTLTSDSIDQWLQAAGLRNITQYHPALMTVMIKFTYQIIQSPAVFITFQIAFCSYVLSTFLYYLFTKGLSLRIIYLFSIIFVLIPTNQLIVISMWKDIIYTFSLLWLTYFCLLFQTDEKFILSNKKNILYFIIAVILASLFRYNGVGPLVFIILYMFYLAIKRKNIKYFIISLLIIISVAFVNGPLLKFFGTTDDGQITNSSYSPITNLVTRSTGRALLYNKTVPKYTEKVVKKYAPLEILRIDYNPYSIDSYGFNNEIIKYQKELKNRANISNFEAIKAYLLLFMKTPTQVIYERLEGTDILWNMTPIDSFNHRYGSGIWLPNNLSAKEEKELKKINKNISRTQVSYLNENVINKEVQKMAGKICSVYVFDNIVSRCGLYLGLILIIILFILKNNKELIATCIPLIANTATWVLLLAYQAYRYVWYFPILTIFIFLVAICYKENN